MKNKPGGRFDIRQHLDHNARDPRPLVCPPRGIGLIWSAKSACTTAVLWYFSVAGLSEAVRNYSDWPHDFRNKVFLHLPAYKAWIVNADAVSLHWIRVIRDPYRRAVSGYRHAIRHGYEDSRIGAFLDRNVKERGYSFAEFLEYLTSIDISRCDPHHRQQFHPIEKIVIPDIIVNAENTNLMDALFEFADPGEAGRTYLFDECKRIAAIHHAKRVKIRRDVSHELFTRDQAGGDWPDYSDFLTAQSQSAIRRIYAVDFEAYDEFL